MASLSDLAEGARGIVTMPDGAVIPAVVVEIAPYSMLIRADGSNAAAWFVRTDRHEGKLHGVAMDIAPIFSAAVP